MNETATSQLSVASMQQTDTKKMLLPLPLLQRARNVKALNPKP